MAKTVVGLFDSRLHADQAVQGLVDNGIDRNNISVVANNNVDGTLDNVETTTGDSAATGAATGAIGGGVLGGALGLLVGLGALAIPGIGPVIAAGPIAAALGAGGMTALVGAGIGAAGGGLLGALVGAGVPEEEANYYAEGVRRGGTLVTANVDDALAGSAYNVMQQYGAIDIDNRGAEWRGTGWDRFDPEGGEWDRSSKIGTGTGTVAGAATGAAMGSVGGPIGTAVGGLAGAAVGAAGGAAADAVGQEATETAGSEPRSNADYDATRGSTVNTGVTGANYGTTGAMGTTGAVTNDYDSTRTTDPVMSDESDPNTRVVREGDAAGTRRGARIYGEGNRYNYDEGTSSLVAAGAANYGGISGTSGVMGNTPASGLAAASALNADTGDYPRDTRSDDYVHTDDTPAEDWKESSKVGTGTGTVAGAATGAAMGSVGGPVGTVIGGVAGAVTGAVTGAAGDAAGEAAGDATRGEDTVDPEVNNDVGGRKGQVKPSQ